jgi:hypothetical protein
MIKFGGGSRSKVIGWLVKKGYDLAKMIVYPTITENSGEDDSESGDYLNHSNRRNRGSDSDHGSITSFKSLLQRSIGSFESDCEPAND